MRMRDFDMKWVHFKIFFEPAMDSVNNAGVFVLSSLKTPAAGQKVLSTMLQRT